MERIIETSHGTRLCIDEFGDPADPLALQLEGHMAQLIATPASFCTQLAERGFYVVRVDNRDVGRSQRFVDRRYSLHEMAEDVHGLIESLGGAPAIVCGRSMGGMIAQLLAIDYPADVLALGLFFSAAPSERSAHPDPIVFPQLEEEEDFVRWQLETLPGIAGPAYPASHDDIVAIATQAWARGVDTGGFERQLRAMRRTSDWSVKLLGIGVPVTIIHGDADPVIPVRSAHALNRVIRRSHLEIVEGMGHQQPVELNDFFVDAVVDLHARCGVRH